jgi:23S rRNA (pseudouridine1915-N3)-methyltransferase
MRIVLVCVGRAGGVLEPAIREYAARASRYWQLDVVEVREERARKGLTEAQVRDAEGARILKRVPKQAELVALTRTGDASSSAQLARQLDRHAASVGTDITYAIGGALGLSEDVLNASRRQLALSTFTLPHDLARLLLLEQLYRAGTILRNEPYHKGGDEE